MQRIATIPLMILAGVFLGCGNTDKSEVQYDLRPVANEINSGDTYDSALTKLMQWNGWINIRRRKFSVAQELPDMVSCVDSKRTLYDRVISIEKRGGSVVTHIEIKFYFDGQKIVAADYNAFQNVLFPQFEIYYWSPEWARHMYIRRSGPEHRYWL